MELVRGRLMSFTPSDFGAEPLFSASTHLLNNPGKCLRAALVLSSADALNLEPLAGFIDLALAFEVLHAASLIVDDQIDRDKTRRGVPAVHIKYGLETAVLASHAEVAKAIELAARYGQDVMVMAAHAARDMSDGEQRDMNMQRRGQQPDLTEYIDMIDRKTASLIAVSLSAPAVNAGNRQLADILHEMGMNMGRSFQIRDDILEYTGFKERESENSESERLARPNIVRVFEAAGRDTPLSTAIKLNNHYVGEARKLLGQLPDPGLFEEYLAFLEIKQ